MTVRKVRLTVEVEVDVPDTVDVGGPESQWEYMLGRWTTLTYEGVFEAFGMAALQTIDVHGPNRQFDTDYRIALRPRDPLADPLDRTTPQDDIVVNDVSMFRAEDMGDWWWVGCYLNGSDERITFATPPGVWTVVETPQVVYEHDAEPCAEPD